MAKVEVIRVFIASPSDLSEERRLFPEILDQINDIKAASLNYQLEPLGWEDALPGWGRPVKRPPLSPQKNRARSSNVQSLHITRQRAF
jgi:hypothetical protein